MSLAPTSRPTRNDSDAGFTLAETLIACSLTLLVFTGAIETLTRSASLVGTSKVISETNHGLQAAMSLLVRDLMQAGQGMPIGGVSIPSNVNGQPAVAQAIIRPGPTAGLTFPVAATLPSLTPGASFGPVAFGVDATWGPPTDMVTVLYVDRTLNLSQYPLIAIANTGLTMTVDVRTNILGPEGIKAGDIIMFNNVYGSTLQMVTVNPTTQIVTFDLNDPLRLNQRNAPGGTLMNLRTPAGLFPVTTASRVVMISYHVDVTTDPTLPRLVRRVNNGPPLAVAMGIENLQITYDLVDGQTNPTNVDTPGPGLDPSLIRKANLYLAARSQDLNPQTRQYFRNSMATQVGLRSLSFKDRYR